MSFIMMVNLIIKVAILMIVSHDKQSHAFETDTCTYSFNIPAGECEVQTASPAINRKFRQQQAINKKIQAQLEILTTTVSGIQNSDDNNEGSIAAGVGSTYVRWGRTVCPETAEIVYEGYVGKSHYGHSGGGVDYQCLPKDPEYPEGVTGSFQSHVYMYGVEYGATSTLWTDIQDGDVPCAVCSVNGRTRQLMIPAKLSCPDDWTMEYSGLMASQLSSQKAATYICVDSNREEVIGGHAKKGGGSLNVVEAACGSLKCPPYEQGYEIACTVCTR